MGHRHHGNARFWVTRLKCFGELNLVKITRLKAENCTKNTLGNLNSNHLLTKSIAGSARLYSYDSPLWAYRTIAARWAA